MKNLEEFERNLGYKFKKSELKIPEGHKENEEIGANFYPVRIEFLDENFETLGIITFDKFTIATFEGFENYREG